MTDCWCLNRLRDYGEVIQTLFDEKPYNPVRIEQEVAPGSVLVPDDGVEGFELSCLRQRKD